MHSIYNNEEYLVKDEVFISKDKQKSFVLQLNLYAILTVIILIMTTGIFFNEGTIKIDSSSSYLLDTILFFGSFILYIVVHELLHGLAFILFGKVSIKDIKFGVILKSGMAYCISTVPVKVNAARISLMMPVYVVCIPLYVYAFITHSFLLAILAILFFSGSVADIYYLWKLRKTNKNYYMYEKPPTKNGYEIGYILYEKV